MRLKNVFIWRRGIVYAYSCLDFYSEIYPNARDPWAYIGQTRQTLLARNAQHMESQPWADLLPEQRVLFNIKYCPQWTLNLVEKVCIKWFKPTYNYVHNTRNSARITLPQARSDRKLRNRKRRIRRW